MRAIYYALLSALCWLPFGLWAVYEPITVLAGIAMTTVVALFISHMWERSDLPNG